VFYTVLKIIDQLLDVLKELTQHGILNQLISTVVLAPPQIIIFFIKLMIQISSLTVSFSRLSIVFIVMVSSLLQYWQATSGSY
jgi:uncharacterized protein YjgD (DUF1641 family)